MSHPETQDGVNRLLEQAEGQVKELRLDECLVIDADVHHSEALAEISDFMDEPYRERVKAREGLEFYILPYDLGDPAVGSKVGGPSKRLKAGEVSRQVRRIGVDASILYPTEILHLGLSPQEGMEAAIAEGYARWVTEKVLPEDPSMKAMLYLPFSNPDVSLRIVEQYSEHPSVAGFLVTSIRNEQVHHNRHARVYHALSEREQVLAFHPAPYWRDQQFGIFNQLLSVHALSIPFYNIVHMINIVVHGLPERYPGIRWLFPESGISWVTFLVHRLDNEYMMRPSEAPVLKKKPGEYIREFYFTTQPLERVDDPDNLAALMNLVGPKQLLYASNYPRWDFEPPARICDLPFLSEEDRLDILGRNAARLFKLEDAKVRSTAG